VQNFHSSASKYSLPHLHKSSFVTNPEFVLNLTVAHTSKSIFNHRTVKQQLFAATVV